MTSEGLSASQYLLDDHPRTLFPLETTRILVEEGQAEIKSLLAKEMAVTKKDRQKFLPQLRCYAAKKGFHLRRTVVLDPIAEFFLYDLVNSNRKFFRRDTRKTRRQYGYFFERGYPVSAMTAYREFRSDCRAAEKEFKFGFKLDIASCFNSIYHHDLGDFFRELKWSDEDVAGLERVLSETSGTRSIDCLPHGYHPCKVLGSAFLHIVDRNARLRSDVVFRFLDDIHLYSNDEGHLTHDLVEVQRIIGEKGLSLNAEKSVPIEMGRSDVEHQVDDLKASLLKLRSRRIEVSGEETDEEELVEEYDNLSEEQTDYLLGLLRDAALDESDAELVLTLLSDHGEEVLSRMASVWPQFPSLSKPVFNFVDRGFMPWEVGPLAKAFLENAQNATEYQLFWLAKTLESGMGSGADCGEYLVKVFDHENATPIVKAKVLEIPESGHGLTELRESTLKQGQSDWPSWAAAIGCRGQSKASRNKVIKNFGSVSQINQLVATVASRIDNRPASDLPF